VAITKANNTSKIVLEDSIEQDTTNLALRKSGQRSRLSSYLRDYDVTHDTIVTSDENLVNFALITESEPITFEETARDGHWWRAMEEEIDFIKRNNT